MESIDHDLAAKPPPIPVTILTGFLGAGKTTLLNRILKGGHGLKAAVLVNDFGAINIDAELVVGVEDNVISLANGCICCSLRDDLVQTILETIDRPERPEYILLEASGVADPISLGMTFNNPKFLDRIRMDSITCVLDAEQVFAHPEYSAVMDLKLRQIACADMIILNKVKLAGPEQVQKVRDWLDEHFNNLRIVETEFCSVPYEILLGVGRFDPANLNLAAGLYAPRPNPGQPEEPGDEQLEHGHVDMFETWSYETDQPLSLEALRAVVRKLPGSVYRCKGIINCSEAPKRRAVLQVVGRRVDIALMDEWNGSRPGTRIVAVGAPGFMDGVDLGRRFEACVVTIDLGRMPDGPNPPNPKA